MAEHRISQAALARRSGFGKERISRWLSGKVEPSLESMVQLDEALSQLTEGD